METDLSHPGRMTLRSYDRHSESEGLTGRLGLRSGQICGFSPPFNTICSVGFPPKSEKGISQSSQNTQMFAVRSLARCQGILENEDPGPNPSGGVARSQQEAARGRESGPVAKGQLGRPTLAEVGVFLILCRCQGLRRKFFRVRSMIVVRGLGS